MTCGSVQHFEIIHNEDETLALGKEIAKTLNEGIVVYFSGQLGAGKTTFCRGILRGLGYSGAVKSPTYTLVEPYALDTTTIYHFDLYRLGHPEELEYMGIRDYFNDAGICLIEWFEKGEGILPKADMTIKLTPLNEGREACITVSDQYKTMVEPLKKITLK